MNALVPIDFIEQSTPGSNPPTGYLRIYTKSDGRVYALNSSGVETLVGPSAGSPLPALYMAS